MRKLIHYFRQCFCNHKLELVAKVTLYEDDDDNIPSGYKRVYLCEKCGYSYILKY